MVRKNNSFGKIGLRGLHSSFEQQLNRGKEQSINIVIFFERRWTATMLSTPFNLIFYVYIYMYRCHFHYVRKDGNMRWVVELIFLKKEFIARGEGM
jgi:hypothetical protein